MKKIISISCMYALVSAMTICTNAQQSSKGYIEYSFAGDRPLTKPYQVNIRAMRDFIQSFKNASGIDWYKVSDGFIVRFTDDSIKTQSGYDRRGNWLYNLRTYSEDILPRDVRAKVKSVYYDYSIILVDEITAVGTVVYIVHVEDRLCFKLLRVVDGEEMEEVKQIDKNKVT